MISEKEHQKLKRWKNRNVAIQKNGAGFCTSAVLLEFCISFLVIMFGITTVKNEDMSPRMSAGDLVLYYRLDKHPVAGDVIVYKKDDQQYVGRIVAKGGDSVEITEQATVKVNESVVLEQNIFYQTPQYESDVIYPLQLQEQQYFVLGDYREGATDSRYFGAVDTREIKGKIITVIRRNSL